MLETILITAAISVTLGLAIGSKLGRVAERGEADLQRERDWWGGEDETILALSPGALLTDEDAVEQRPLNQMDLDRVTGVLHDVGPTEVLEIVAEHINTRPSYGMLTVNDQMAHDALVSAIEHLRTAEQLASRPVRLVASV
ncbi:MAG: hypothetical protein AAGD32_17405 [Planctomycetota bacterium]